MSSNGNIQVRYDYDVFGKITAVKNGSNQAITDTSSLAFLNPLRYRGYYFDAETGLYYLMSCYYDPVTHRFINADGYFQTGGDILDANMSAYCANNPIIRSDPNGEFWGVVIGIAIVVGICALTFSGDSTLNTERARENARNKYTTQNVNVYPKDDEKNKKVMLLV